MKPLILISWQGSGVSLGTTNALLVSSRWRLLAAVQHIRDGRSGACGTPRLIGLQGALRVPVERRSGGLKSYMVMCIETRRGVVLRLDSSTHGRCHEIRLRAKLRLAAHPCSQQESANRLLHAEAHNYNWSWSRKVYTHCAPMVNTRVWPPFGGLH